MSEYQCWSPMAQKHHNQTALQHALQPALLLHCTAPTLIAMAAATSTTQTTMKKLQKVEKLQKKTKTKTTKITW